MRNAGCLRALNHHSGPISMNFSSATGLADSEEVWVEVCKDLSRKVGVRREESSGGGRYRELDVPGAGAFLDTPSLRARPYEFFVQDNNGSN